MKQSAKMFSLSEGVLLSASGMGLVLFPSIGKSALGSTSNELDSHISASWGVCASLVGVLMILNAIEESKSLVAQRNFHFVLLIADLIHCVSLMVYGPNVYSSSMNSDYLIHIFIGFGLLIIRGAMFLTGQFSADSESNSNSNWNLKVKVSVSKVVIRDSFIYLCIFVCTIFGMEFIRDKFGGVNSDIEGAQFISAEHRLQFCEIPFAYSEFASQFVSFIFHLPFIVLGVLFFYGKQLSTDALKVLATQTALHLWTGFGHWVPIPADYYITEISCIIAPFFFLQLCCMVTSNADFPFRSLMSQILFSGVQATVMYFFGLIPLMLTLSLFFSYVMFRYGCVDAFIKSRNTFCAYGFVAMLLTNIGFLAVEGTFCSSLLEFYEFPYHAIFDCCFFQIYLLFVWYILLPLATKNKSQFKSE